MRKVRRLVALLVVVSILLSFGCVCLLYAYPAHTHTGHGAHCVLCTIAANVGNLIQTTQALTTLFVLILGLVCLGLLRALRREAESRQVVTPVTLKIKLSW